MVRVTAMLQILLLVLVLRHSYAVSDQLSELEEERDLLETNIAGITS